MTTPYQAPRIRPVGPDRAGAELLRKAYRAMNQAGVEAFEHESPDIGDTIGRALHELRELAKYLGVSLEAWPGSRLGLPAPE